MSIPPSILISGSILRERNNSTARRGDFKIIEANQFDTSTLTVTTGPTIIGGLVTITTGPTTIVGTTTITGPTTVTGPTTLIGPTT